MNVQQHMVSCAEMAIALTVLAPSSVCVRMAMISLKMGRTVLVCVLFFLTLNFPIVTPLALKYLKIFFFLSQCQ